MFFRFMSLKEFNKLTAHIDIIGTSDFSTKRTASKGVCFMSTEDFTPEYAYEFLRGIVSKEVVVIFENISASMNESWGVYADPCGGYFDTFVATEYCTNYYNDSILKPIKYGVIDSFGDIDWYDCN